MACTKRINELLQNPNGLNNEETLTSFVPLAKQRIQLETEEKRLKAELQRLSMVEKESWREFTERSVGFLL
jgi:hypothetical protein